MAALVMILVAVALFIAGVVVWYTMWHRRMAASFERVRVNNERSAQVVRRNADFTGDAR